MGRTITFGIASQLGRRFRPVAAPLAWLWLLVFCAGTGVGAFLWLLVLPPLPDCKQPQLLPLDGDRLYCAEQIAQAGNVDALVSGLDLVRDWSREHPLYGRATHLLDEWSATLLELARVKAVEADLGGAISLATKIPSSSSLYKDARAAIITWQGDLNQGQAIVDSVQAAIRDRNWGVAVQRLRDLSRMESDYWVQQVGRLRQQISAEQVAARQLQQARTLAASAAENVQVLGRAIALAEQINPDTYAATAAKAEAEHWMAALFAIVSGQLPRKIGLEEAVAAVQRIPRGVPVPDARDILWVSRAQPLVTDPLPRGSLHQQLWQLWNVFAQVRQIPTNSPLFPQARAVLPKLQMQIQDVTQLNFASALASLWQIPTLQVGIHIAQGIAPDRPRRIYSQTLITMWKKDIERLQDRPYLAQAEQIAAPGTPQALRQAISYANQILPGRALHGESRLVIGQWMRQIELVEDEPLLKQAQVLAKQQRLHEAIQIASKIRPGRSLYKESQTAIGDWVYQIQLGEDSPLLERAYGIASQGNRAAAIRLATQILPGRPLYNEAQKAIANWANPRRNQKSESSSESNSQNSLQNFPNSTDGLSSPNPSPLNPFPLSPDPFSPFPSSRQAPPNLPAVNPSSAPFAQPTSPANPTATDSLPTSATPASPLRGTSNPYIVPTLPVHPSPLLPTPPTEGNVNNPAELPLP